MVTIALAGGTNEINIKKHELYIYLIDWPLSSTGVIPSILIIERYLFMQFFPKHLHIGQSKFKMCMMAYAILCVKINNYAFKAESKFLLKNDSFP